MTVPETAFKGNQDTQKTSQIAWILAILVLSASASFGLGMLTEKSLQTSPGNVQIGQGGPIQATK